MQKRNWLFLSFGVAITAVLLLAGRVEKKTPTSKEREDICQKSKGKDCSKKDQPGMMILESLPRQFILISPLSH